MAVEVKSDFMLEGLEDLSAGCRFTGNEILKIDTQTIVTISKHFYILQGSLALFTPIL